MSDNADELKRDEVYHRLYGPNWQSILEEMEDESE